MSDQGSSDAQLTTDVVDAAETLAAILLPGGAPIVAGLNAVQIGNLILGAAGAVPALTDAWNALKASVGGTNTPPTPAQLLADFNTASAADDALAQADADVMKGGA